jgi:ribosomal protein L37AE/L43A
MNERLSRLIASLLAQAKGGEELSSGISRIRAVIKKVIEGEDTIFGKLHALVESLRDVIPEEKQRYHVAIKALSTTSKLSRHEIAAAIDNQLEELKILEKLLISALPSGAGQLKALEAKSQKMRDEISRLREKTAQLEQEEKDIASSMRGRETAALEKALREVFTDIGAVITSIKKKVEEQHGELAAQQPIPDMEIKIDFNEQKQGGGQKTMTGQISSHNAAKPQKTCPMCGGQMSFALTRNRWQCFSCAYEEWGKDEVQRGDRELNVDTIFPEPAPASEPKQKCRMCGGRVDYYLAEKKWQCFSCGFEEPEKAEVPSGKGESGKDTILAEPIAVPQLKQNGEKDRQRTTPEPTPALELKQKCPMCGGQMDYYISDRKWQCYSCGFENNESTKNEGQAQSEGKRDSNALLAISASEPLFDHSSTTPSSPGYWEPRKASPTSKKLPAISKPCPACKKKMHWYGTDRGWQCHSCGYERRI